MCELYPKGTLCVEFLLLFQTFFKVRKGLCLPLVTCSSINKVVVLVSAAAAVVIVYVDKFAATAASVIVFVLFCSGISKHFAKKMFLLTS